MQLTEHFSLDELITSSTAMRLGIDNTPAGGIILNLRRTAALGERLREALNVEAMRRGISQEVRLHTDSGYRCESLEKVLCVNGFAAWCIRHDADKEASWPAYFSTKQHPKGMAMDFKAPVFGTPYQIVAFIASRPELMAQIDQLIMEGDWVHVSWDATPRMEVITASFDANGMPSYKNGLS